MPTKDGISGTGIMPGRTHVRREWSANSTPRPREFGVIRAPSKMTTAAEDGPSHGIKAYVERLMAALKH